MNHQHPALNLKFIESYLREGAKSNTYVDLKRQLYSQGYTKEQVVTLLVESDLYGNLDNFYRRHPGLQ